MIRELENKRRRQHCLDSPRISDRLSLVFMFTSQNVNSNLILYQYYHHKKKFFACVRLYIPLMVCKYFTLFWSDLDFFPYIQEYNEKANI